VRAKIDDMYHEIADSDEFNSATAITNATDFSVDEYEIQDIDFDEGECVVKMTFSASGEQLEDRMFSGDRIVGDCEAVIDSEGALSTGTCMPRLITAKKTSRSSIRALLMSDLPALIVSVNHHRP
jgi:hypothetical protein